jgi:dCTP deaminase
MPGEHILVSALESIKMPDDLMAVMYPRTSTNRKGLSVDQTGIIDSGYEGPMIIPVRNNTASQTVRLYPGERFCQLVFEQLTVPIKARKSRYHQQEVAGGVNVDKLQNERDIEIALVQSGDIAKLKTDFPA